MTDADLKAHCTTCWAALTDAQRQELVTAAVAALRGMETASLGLLREMAASNPVLWATPHHFIWGMWMRNRLRGAGCQDSRYPTGNLDDYYVRAVEEALHVI